MKHRQVGVNRVGIVNPDGHSIGLDIGATAVRASILASGTLDGRPSVTIHGIGQVELASGVVVKGEVREPDSLTAALKQLWALHKFECRNVILGIANPQVLVRDLSVPNIDAQRRAKALPFQAKEVIALPIDEVVLDFSPLETSADGETLHGLLIAAPRKPLRTMVDAVERAKLRVARVDLASFGTLRAIAGERLAVEAVIDLGAHLTTMIIHDHGVPRLVRTLARGGDELTVNIAERLNIELLQAETIKRERGLDSDDPEIGRALAESLRPLMAEIRTSIGYFRSSRSTAPIERISLTGGGANLSGIAKVMSDQTGLPTSVVDPLQHVRNRHASKQVRSELEGAPSAVSLGLAMGPQHDRACEGINVASTPSAPDEGGRMTTLLSAEPGSANIWASMPGWGIVADLTPPELVAARSLRVLRKQLAAGLLILVLVCVAGYAWAARQNSAADDRLAASRVTTARLTAQNAKYSNVIQLQSATAGITSQISTLMASDVDVAAFVQRIEAAAPAGTTFTSLAVTLSADGGIGTAGTVGTEPVVGTITLSGTSKRMVDVASYVTALQNLAGVVNVIPSTNSASKAGGRATWSITAQMTDKLYTHRFTAAPATTGTKAGGH